MLMRPDGRKLYLEVKSVTLAEPFDRRHEAGLTGEAAAAAAAAAAKGGKKGRGRKRGAEEETAGSGAAAAAEVAAEAAAGEGGEGGEWIGLFPDTVSERAQRHVKVRRAAGTPLLGCVMYVFVGTQPTAANQKNG